MPHQPDTTKAQATNIDTVVRLEAEDEKRVSDTHRFSQAIGSFAGPTGGRLRTNSGRADPVFTSTS
jgi:hypothetical protein